MRAAVVAALVTAFLAGAGSARAEPYHIVFSADRDGDRDLYAASVNGDGAVAITRNAQDDVGALLSPDRRSIALKRGPNLVLLEPGARERVIARGLPQAWSPDGRQLAFVAAPKYELRILDLVRGRTRQVTHWGHGAWFPSWSPNGRQIAFEDADGSAFIVDLATGRRTAIGLSDEFSPIWSPTGFDVAYAGERDNFLSAVTVISPHEKPFVIQGDWPDWSPGGRELA